MFMELLRTLIKIVLLLCSYSRLLLLLLLLVTTHAAGEVLELIHCDIVLRFVVWIERYVEIDSIEKNK